jgi:hypothetical protein
MGDSVPMRTEGMTDAQYYALCISKRMTPEAATKASGHARSHRPLSTVQRRQQ